MKTLGAKLSMFCSPHPYGIFSKSANPFRLGPIRSPAEYSLLSFGVCECEEKYNIFITRFFSSVLLCVSLVKQRKKGNVLFNGATAQTGVQSLDLTHRQQHRRIAVNLSRERSKGSDC